MVPTDSQKGHPDVLCAVFSRGQGVGLSIMFLVKESFYGESQESTLSVFADLIVMR